MKRVFVIAACGLSLAACSGMPSFMQFELPRSAPAATTVQFESEPAGAEVKTSIGPGCRTPCSLALTSDEFTANFALPGYHPQTVPVRVVVSDQPADPATGVAPAPRLVPNPVFVELLPAAPPPQVRKKPPPRKRTPKPVAQRQAPAAMAPPPRAPAPAPAPASPWPPPAPAR